MAHDFLGSFNQAQFDRFKAFAKNQQSDITARINHLESEIERVGVLSLSYDSGGIPTGHAASPKTSYLARLLAAYEVLGGDVEYDLNVRSREQPLFLLKADESSPAQMYSDGTVMGSQGNADSASAQLMQSMRSWIPEVMDYRHEYLERKIRRMIDYVDQLQVEVEQLKGIAATDQVEGSFDFFVSEIEALLNDPSYRAVSKGGDVHNKKGGAPFASYEPGPKGSTADTFQRGFSGVQDPGDSTGDTDFDPTAEATS